MFEQTAQRVGGFRDQSRLIRMPGDRRWSFALRNSFRRPWRLALTLLALSAGGALLLTTHNNYESLMRVIDRALAKILQFKPTQLIISSPLYRDRQPDGWRADPPGL